MKKIALVAIGIMVVVSLFGCQKKETKTLAVPEVKVTAPIEVAIPKVKVEVSTEVTAPEATVTVQSGNETNTTVEVK